MKNAVFWHGEDLDKISENRSSIYVLFSWLRIG